ncbi:MAG: HAMP domain-containing sensor histidine kinase [Campylobacterota bacterium]|nr:HAMP domain-containing sensor histidine kinase [Campylobacterota bacterium]
MLSQKSIRTSFLIKLSAAMAALLLFFSTILYSYITYSVDQELRSSLMKQAKYIFATYPDVKKGIEENHKILQKTLSINAHIIYLPKSHYKSTHIRTIKKGKEYFIELLFPYNFENQTYLNISANVTEQKRLQQQVYKAIVFINLLGMGLIILYAYFLSGMLINPIRILAKKLSIRNEAMMEPIKTDDLPREFEPLSESINVLISRIQNFIKYKKELFIGAAHELKTPLAVMKTKTQVTLLKRKTTEEDLKAALKQNITSIDEMNKIVSSILEFGRAEGAQFETPEDIDVIDFLKRKANDYNILANANHQKFSCDLKPEQYIMNIQPLLLTQILQNFIQNALKFTPSEKKVELKSYPQDGHLVIEIIDEGKGIDEGEDLFAPFLRTKDSDGVGLGLFLVKSAADAMGAKTELFNRTGHPGTVARVTLPKYPFCKI